MQTEKTLQVWVEFASTYSHVAVQRLAAKTPAHALHLDWRPFLLGPLFERQQGLRDSPFNVFPTKGAYMWRDMERLCEKHDIPFRRPSVFPRNGLLAARVATAAAGEPWLADFIRAVYLANFADDRDISDPACVASLLESVGCVSPDAFLTRATSDETKARLRSRTEEAQRLGIFGAPTFITSGELFWGQDRLEDAIAWNEPSPAGARSRPSS